MGIPRCWLKAASDRTRSSHPFGKSALCLRYVYFLPSASYRNSAASDASSVHNHPRSTSPVPSFPCGAFCHVEDLIQVLIKCGRASVEDGSNDIVCIPEQTASKRLLELVRRARLPLARCGNNERCNGRNNNCNKRGQGRLHDWTKRDVTGAC